MALLSTISLVAGVFLVGLVALAMVIAGWELLRQREMLDQLRRDRAFYAATSPLPLAGSPAPGAAAVAGHRASVPSAAAPANAPPARREPNWSETRPTVLSLAPAADDETAARRSELDLQID